MAVYSTSNIIFFIYRILPPSNHSILNLKRENLLGSPESRQGRITLLGPRPRHTANFLITPRELMEVRSEARAPANSLNSIMHAVRR